MTRPVVVRIPHTLGKAEARRRIAEGFGRMREQLSAGLAGGGLMGSAFLSMLTFTERWEGDRLLFDGGGMGQKITGRIDVDEDKVVIEVDLPELLATLADRVVGKLTREGTKLLEKK